MGFHVSWVAVSGKAPSAVRSELRLCETSDREEIPESDITGVELRSGWYVVFFNDVNPAELNTDSLARVSIGADLVTCVIEEGAMISMASGFSGGKEVWSLFHDSEKGLTHIEEVGTLPEEYRPIYDRLMSEQEGDESHIVDYVFDIPVELAKQITEFRHDQFLEGFDEDPFVVLERT